MSAAVAVGSLPAAIRVEHQAAQAAAGEAVRHAIRAGELLLQARAALPHGEFGAWLEASVEFSARTAQGYMRLAELDEQKRNAVADLSLRSALRTLAVPRANPPPHAPDAMPTVAWERLPAPHVSLGSWDARPLSGLAAVRESAQHPGYFDMCVIVGASLVSLGRCPVTDSDRIGRGNGARKSRPIRHDAVGQALAWMGVRPDVRWNFPGVADAVFGSEVAP